MVDHLQQRGTGSRRLGKRRKIYDHDMSQGARRRLLRGLLLCVFSDVSFSEWANRTNQRRVGNKQADESDPGPVRTGRGPFLDASVSHLSLCCDLFGLDGAAADPETAAVTETLVVTT